MTVPVSTPAGSYVSDGGLTPRDIAFPFLAAADIIVTVDDAARTLNADYEISGAYPAATLVPLAGFATNGQTVRYWRSTTARQDYAVSGNAIVAKSLELALDRPTLIAQEQAALLSRAVLVPRDEQGVTIPGVDARKGKALGFDLATGEPVAIDADSFAAANSAAAAHLSELAAAGSAGAAAASAGAAAGSAGAASTSAGLSDAARVLAEAARDAAAIAGNLFADTATGLANTSGTGATNRYFGVPSAGDTFITEYRNDAGVATLINVYPSSSYLAKQVPAERARRLTSSVLAAAKSSSKISLLTTKDGTQTLRAGSATDIDSCTVLIGPGPLVQNANTYNGTNGAGLPLRPTAPGTGFLFHPQVGFDLNYALPADTTNFGLDVILHTAPEAVDYASEAARTADIGARRMGDIALQNGGPFCNTAVTTGGADYADKYLRMSTMQDSALLQGLYVFGNGSYSNPSSTPILSWYSSDFTKYGLLSFDRKGRLVLNTYDGVLGVALYSWGTDVWAAGQTAPQHCHIDVADGELSMWLNGVEIAHAKGTVSFTPAHFYVNGGKRQANNIVPVNGFVWTMDALCLTTGLDWPEKRAVSDALAAEFGTPKRAWDPIVLLGIHDGQSNGAGSTDTSGDPNRPDAVTGFNGMITSAGADLPSKVTLSNISLPRTYACASPNDPTNIGPVIAPFNVYGNPSGSGLSYTASSSGTETVEWSVRAQLNRIPYFRDKDLVMVGTNYGGFSYGLITSTTNPYIYDLLTTPLGSTTVNALDYSDRMVAAAVAKFRKRGQTVRLAYLYQDQGETLFDLPIDPATGVFYTQDKYGAAREASVRSRIINRLWHLVDPTGPAPIAIQKPIDYSGDGISNKHMVSPYYYGDQLRKLEATRDALFRYALLGDGYGRFGRFIHKPLIWHRKRGDAIGSLIVDAYNGVSTKVAQVTSVAIVAGKLRLYLSEAFDVVDVAYPNVPMRHTTGGIDTYGLVLEVAGKTIAAVDNTHAGDAMTPYIEVTGSTAFVALDGRINVTGTNATYSNYRRKARTYGLYQDQDWSASPGNFTSGSPPYTPGPLNDLTPWLAAGTYPF